MKHPGVRLLLALALPAALAACAEYPDTLPRERFVEVNVALRSLDVPAADSTATRADSLRLRQDSARARAAVLRKGGVTERDLQAFVDARRTDTEALSETWREIAARLAMADSVARADSVRRDSLARPGKDSAAARRDSGRATPPPTPPRATP